MVISKTETLSSTFIWRRVHSLMGLWLIIYLFEHLIVNSQATLWVGDDGIGFIKMVNLLESLPFLQVIEWLLIGIPLFVHGIWGVKRALQAKTNAGSGNGNAPRLPYSRNRAFTWQRLSSWILLVGIIAHVIQMRFIGYPTKVQEDHQIYYLTKISFDEGLYTLSERLHVTLFSPEMVDVIRSEKKETLFSPLQQKQSEYSSDRAALFEERQREIQQQKWMKAITSFDLKKNEVIAECQSPGAAMLLMVRNHFKSPVMAFLYTVFVLAAAFHAFNGFWTAMITWGVLLSYRSQKAMLPFMAFGVFLLSFLGLAAIWGSYWINLHS